MNQLSCLTEVEPCRQVPSGVNLQGETFVLRSVGGINLKGKYSTAIEPEPEAPQIVERRSLRPSTWKKEVTVEDDGKTGQELLDEVLYERDNPTQVNVTKATGIEGLHLSIGTEAPAVRAAFTSPDV